MILSDFVFYVHIGENIVLIELGSISRMPMQCGASPHSQNFLQSGRLSNKDARVQRACFDRLKVLFTRPLKWRPVKRDMTSLAISIPTYGS